jgi:hypothetical protein
VPPDYADYLGLVESNCISGAIALHWTAQHTSAALFFRRAGQPAATVTAKNQTSARRHTAGKPDAIVSVRQLFMRARGLARNAGSCLYPDTIVLFQKAIMKFCSLFTAAMLPILLAACSADGPATAAQPGNRTDGARAVASTNAGTPASNANMAIDPAIPALTIVGRRMSDSEKSAYDSENQTPLAAAMAAR